MHNPVSKFQFPWRRGNRFELLVDGHAYFPRMLEAVELARRYVLLEIYLFESGAVANRFIEALVRAAARGVSVKVLTDGFGAAMSPASMQPSHIGLGRRCGGVVSAMAWSSLP